MNESLALWEVVGVEIRYMIVDATTLDVKPAADRLLPGAGDGVPDVVRGPVSWSNGTALHVIELKTAGPVPGFAGLAAPFQESVSEMAGVLRGVDARLMPGGMHPWMDPEQELRIWPHEHNEVYRALDRIFGCRGHGWANLQSTHLNLPFQGDEEFALLHDAIRLVLPLVPALAASSPVLDGRPGSGLDNGLLAYREKTRAVPSVGGDVVPERVASTAEYREVVLERIYRDLEELDPEGVLRHEWVNARGATPLLERGSIEIRVIDCQECVPADLAVAAAVAAAVRGLARPDGPVPDDVVLRDVLDRTIRRGREALVTDGAYLERLGFLTGGPQPAGAVWARLAAPVLADSTVPELHAPLALILDQGPLAERLQRAFGAVPSRAQLREAYELLCGCVEAGEPFQA